MQLVRMTQTHWPEVRRIYQDGMDSGLATFETQVPDWKVWNKKFLQSCRIVALNPGVCGWAALQPVSSREAYRGVAEVSLYVDVLQGRQGIGTSLMKQLIIESEEHGIYMLTASIFEKTM